MKKKLGSRRGESISETLISLLVIALASVMVCGAVVSAANINQKVAEAPRMNTTAGADNTHGTITSVKIVKDIKKTGTINEQITINSESDIPTAKIKKDSAGGYYYDW